MQLQNQFEHNAQQILPKLYGIKRIVESLSMMHESSPSFAEFRNVIASLHLALGEGPVHHEGHTDLRTRRQHWDSANNMNVTVRTQNNLRALSLERGQAQKRKDSQNPY